MNLSTLKSKTTRTVRAAKKMETRAFAVEQKALDDYVRKACPFEPGDVVKVRDSSGRMRYWRVSRRHGCMRTAKKPGQRVYRTQPIWSCEVYASTVKGDYTIRRGSGRVDECMNATLHIKAAQVS